MIGEKASQIPTKDRTSVFTEIDYIQKEELSRMNGMTDSIVCRLKTLYYFEENNEIDSKDNSSEKNVTFTTSMEKNIAKMRSINDRLNLIEKVLIDLVG